MRLLILGCARSKLPDAGLLPARQRYAGPAYRVLHRYLRDRREQHNLLTILILSAQFGLISGDTPIPYYDRRMTERRAIELQPQVYRQAARLLAGRPPYAATLVHLGQDYLPALVWPAELQAQLGTLTSTSGGIGTRLGQLKRWLEDKEVAI